MINDTKENRALLVKKKKTKTVKNDTPSKKSTEQGGVNIDGVSESAQS